MAPYCHGTTLLLLLLLLLNTVLFVVCYHRRTYVVERNETLNGHVYLVREEQPFFRVYHMPHRKVFRDNPDAGKMSQAVTSSMQAQLAEEHGSDQRMKMAAEFWREHNKHHNGHEHGEKGQQRRSKRAGTSLLWGWKKQQNWVNGGGEDEDLKGGGEGGMGNFNGGNNGGGEEGMMGQQQQMMGKPMAFWPGQQQQQQQQQSFLMQESMARQIFQKNQNRTSAKFGHHHLPTGEQKDTADWPWQLWPYLHCLTMECVCPLFRGTVRGNFCYLSNGKPLRRAIRKEFRQYTAEERALLLEVLRRYKVSGLYTRMGMVHRRSGVHSGPSFFTWHREFLKRLEMVYRALHPENTEPILGLPYWDSTLDNNLPAPEDSIMFSEFLMGEPDEAGFVTNGLFANWTTMDGRHSFQRMFGDQPDGEFFNDARIDHVLSQDRVDRVLAYSLPLHNCINYDMDDRFLEFSHDYVHYFISGDMQERFSSSNDPIFFMHHGFVDFVWEMWRQKKQNRLQRERDYPRDDGECMPEWHFPYAYMPMLQPMRNMDALSNNYTDHMYEFAERPICRGGQHEECGSEFLWCDTRSNPGHPVCSAKVKPGGNCHGFEWSDAACYRSRCMASGRCSRVGVGIGIGGEEEANAAGERTKMDTGDDWHPFSFMR